MWPGTGDSPSEAMASTFLLASMAAVSAFVAKSSSSVTRARSYLAVEVIFLTPDTEDSASSTGLTTSCSTDSALAPGYLTDTVTYGVLSAGKSSTPMR